MGGTSTPENRGDIEDPNEAYKRRGGDLQLDKLDPKKLKEMLEKHKITDEEWKQHLAAEERRLREQRKPGANPSDAELKSGDRKTGSFVDSGTKRIETDPNASSGQLRSDGAAVAPPQYKDAAKKFAEMLAQPKSKKK